MFEVALTGCRYSGKTSVAKLFKKIDAPVFDADTILKFILNFRTYVDEPIKSNVGSFVYKNGFLDPNAFVTDSLFDRTHGRPTQAVSGPDGGPIVIELVEYK